MEWIEIDKDEPLKPGDRVKLHFKALGLLYAKAAQIAVIEALLGKRADFDLISIEVPPETNVLIFTVEVRKTNPVIITCAVIAGTIALAGTAMWLVLDKTEKMVESPAGQAIGIGAIVIGIIVALGIFGGKRLRK